MAIPISTKIRSIRRARGLNQADFGKLLGVTQGSVSRWETGSMPEPAQVASLAEMYGEDVRTFLGGTSDGAFLPPGKRLMVKGSVAAGVWVEAFEWPDTEWEPYTGGSHVSADPERRFGLRVEGDSMNVVYPHGTILDCVSMWEEGLTPQSGQRVIVVRRRLDDGMEATVKEYLVDDTGKQWLVPRSTNPSFQMPFSMDDPGPDIASVEIVAIVVGSYRPE